MATDEAHLQTWTASTEGLDIVVATDDDAVVLRPHGEIDMSTAPLLTECLESSTEVQARPVVVDLGAVTFLDSTGIRALLEGQRLLAGHGLTLTVRNALESVRRVFTVTGTDQVLGLR